jgi:CubicO group peptidase (beta-lactamase class C family)
MRNGMRIRAAVAGALGALLLAPAALGQGFFPGNDEIRRRLDERLARGGGVGVVVGLLEADGTRRYVVAGSSGNGAPLDEHALFEIGSITKPFTATLLADMAARGEVSLDDPVAKHLPAGTRVPARGGKAITLATLATHTSGLPRLPTNFRPADPKDPFADYGVARLYEFLASYDLTRDPGETWLYSNVGYGLLGHALERRAGTTYAKLLAERLLVPLGMKETSVGLDPSLQKRAVQGFDEAFAPAPMWDLGPLPGAGAIRSTAADMLAFAAANLSAEGDRLHAAMKAAHAPRVPMKDDQRVGLAWMVARPKSRTITWHWGGTGGFRSYLGLDLEARRAVVLLTNSSQMWNDFGHNLLDPEVPLAPAPADGLFAKLLREKGVDAAVARVRELKAKEPGAWSYEEAHFNAAGYRLLAEKRAADAVKVFTLGTELFPRNGNPWDSLGEALLASGEKEKAIAAYRRSVELDPKNRNGIEALEKLTKAP